MSTTVIIVELLIIGVQTLVWVVLLLGRVSPDLISLEELDKPELLATVLVATAYTVGVVADRFLGNLSTNIQKLRARDPYNPGGAAREFYMTEIFKPNAHEHFQTSERQIRLLRATGVNSFITMIVLVAGYREYLWRTWLLSGLLLLLAGVPAWTWCATRRMVNAAHAEFYRACEKDQKQPASTESVNADPNRVDIRQAVG
jgi:hypothetical protein